MLWHLCSYLTFLLIIKFSKVVWSMECWEKTSPCLWSPQCSFLIIFLGLMEEFLKEAGCFVYSSSSTQIILSLLVVWSVRLAENQWVLWVNNVIILWKKSVLVCCSQSRVSRSQVTHLLKNTSSNWSSFLTVSLFTCLSTDAGR